jgi:hypothetical protein
MRISFLGLLVLALSAASAVGQRPPDPELSYVFPPGARAGTTVDVRLAGSDWTPDMQFFVLEPRVKFAVRGSMGKLLMLEPPFLIGPKARDSLPLPREVPVRFVLPADLPTGPIRWQVANANGTSRTGVFVVADGPEIIEDETQSGPQTIGSLPVTISGRLMKNEEIDRYLIQTPQGGPVTCELTARRIGSKFNGVLEIRDSDGLLLADTVDSQGRDSVLTFSTEAGGKYSISLRDLDFRGNRSFVYRLSIRRGPRVLAAIPAAGQRGDSRKIEFVGIGLATGKPTLESVWRTVTFPSDANSTVFKYQLKTDFGSAQAFPLLLSDLPEFVEPQPQTKKLRLPEAPCAITGILDQRFGNDRYQFSASKGEAWQIDVQAARIGSPLDVTVTIYDPQGKQLAANDDFPETTKLPGTTGLPGTTDAGLLLTVPEDGTYEIVVSDVSGESGTRASVYRLVVRRPKPDFSLQVSQRLNVVIGGQAELIVKVTRTGRLREPIKISVAGLPPGVTVPENLTIPGEKFQLKIPLQSASDAPSIASLVTVTGTARIDNQTVTRIAVAQAAGNLAPRIPEENAVTSILVASTMKPRIKIRPVESDERTVHRGSTHLSPVAIERLEGFDGELIVQMEGAQPNLFRQGILGPDVIVPRGVNQVFYPCLVPEVAETLGTYRLSLVALAKVPDARGNVRYLLSRMNPNTSIAISVEGGLLKIAPADAKLKKVQLGQPLDIPLVISWSVKLVEPVRLELWGPPNLSGRFEAKPMVISPHQSEATFRITPTTDPLLVGKQTLTIRATAVKRGDLPRLSETSNNSPLDQKTLSLLKAGCLPIISETTVSVEITP